MTQNRALGFLKYLSYPKREILAFRRYKMNVENFQKSRIQFSKLKFP